MIRLKDGIIITQFNIDDLHQIYNLGLKEQSFIDSINQWTPENLSSLFASDNFTAYTARRKNKVLGFIIGEKENSRMQILWFMVTPHLRKKGIGSALIDYFLKNSAGKSINELFIRINENNLDSINFLCKKGLIVNRSFIELAVKKP
jgi:ribosomal protein S18 acetylase RimI-like enzyme